MGFLIQRLHRARLSFSGSSSLYSFFMEDTRDIPATVEQISTVVADSSTTNRERETGDGQSAKESAPRLRDSGTTGGIIIPTPSSGPGPVYEGNA